MPVHDDLPTPRRAYKSIVTRIRNLRWELLDRDELQRLMVISRVYAREFAEALRIALRLYPADQALKAMAKGELQTSNLQFGDYRRGDHADFLSHFIEHNALRGDAVLERHASLYLDACRSLDDDTRAMSVFSREEELAGIFRRILRGRDWTAPGLAAFQYYLSRHITFDTEEGGHHELTQDFLVDDRLVPFYRARLDTYRCIPRLFTGCRDENDAALSLNLPS